MVPVKALEYVSQLGVVKATIVATVVIKTHNMAVISRQEAMISGILKWTNREKKNHCNPKEVVFHNFFGYFLPFCTVTWQKQSVNIQNKNI